MPNYLDFGGSFGSSNSKNLSASSNFVGFVPVRVKTVNLIPKDNSTSVFKNGDEYWGVGTIQFEPINQNTPITELDGGSIALPLNNNLRTLPVVNEIVYVIQGPSRTVFTESKPNATTYYYTNSLPIWNSVDMNGFPSPLTQGSSNTDSNSIKDIEDGIPNNPDNPKTEPFFGNTFQDQGIIKNLYPVEGDVILEGRFGNSIRMSSTMRYKESFEDFKVSPQNPWSRDGDELKPITIIRNEQKEQLKLDTWEPIFEDINADGSSIYLTSTQYIPIELAYTKLTSYGIDVTPPDDTTAQFDKSAQAEGNEFESNNDADSLGQTSDSINQEPDLSTDPNRIQPLFSDIPTVTQQGSFPTIGGNAANETDFNQQPIDREAENNPNTRPRGGKYRARSQDTVSSASSKKRDRLNRNRPTGSQQESFVDKKRRINNRRRGG